MNNRAFACVAVSVGLFSSIASSQRINHAGRILGPPPTVTAPVLFDTPEADAVVSALQIMPVTNAFNEDVSQLPLDPNSAGIIAQITSDLAPSRRYLAPLFDMNFVLVPDSQPLVPIFMTNFPLESDDVDAVTGIGNYPIPSDLPLESWPRETGTTTLMAWQTDANTGGAHAIMVMPASGPFWETYQTLLTTNTPAWEASNGARFDMTSDALRPDGWTSADAAGLPIFPALVRYDECQRGVVEHAVRLTVWRPDAAYIYPATHAGGPATALARPAMGQRLRLRSSFVIPTTWDACSIAVATGLKKYGGLVADLGVFFSFSITPDERYDANAFVNLQSILPSDFEVVASTGATEGPRSPGAPTVDAGSDLTIALGDSPTLVGTATGSSITTLWYVYPFTPPPGAVMFGAPNALTTTASFSAIGDYTLMLSASDGIHAVAYGSITVHVLSQIPDAGIVDAGMDSATTDGATSLDAADTQVDAAVTEVFESGADTAMAPNDVAMTLPDTADTAENDVGATDSNRDAAVGNDVAMTLPDTAVNDVGATDSNRDAAVVNDAAPGSRPDVALAIDGTTGADASVPGSSGGGCGCSVPGQPHAPPPVLVLLLLLALSQARRDRSRWEVGAGARGKARE